MESAFLSDEIRDRSVHLDLLESERETSVESRRPDGNSATKGIMATAAAVLAVVFVWWSARDSRDRSAGREDPPPIIEVRTLEEIDALPIDTRRVAIVGLYGAEPVRRLQRLRRLHELQLVMGADRRPSAAEVEAGVLAFVDHGGPEAPFADLAKLLTLRTLRIQNGCHVTTEGLRQLDVLPVLEELAIAHAPLGERRQKDNTAPLPNDELLTALTDLRATQLELGPGVGLNDAVLGRIAAKPGLRSLTLYGPRGLYEHSHGPSLSGMQILRAAQSVRKLSLPYSTIRPAHIDILRDMNSLEDFEFGTGHDLREDVIRELFRARPWKRLALPGRHATDAVLRELPASVESLSVRAIPYQGGGFLGHRLPTQLGRLRELSLFGCSEVRASTLQGLSAYPHLERLDLSGCHGVDASALEVVSQHAAGLKLLALANGVSFAQADISCIARLRELVELDLSGYEFLEGAAHLLRPLSGLEQIAALSKLRVLRLDSTEVSAAELRALRKLPLQRLSLRGASIEFDTETPDEASLRALFPPFVVRR